MLRRRFLVVPVALAALAALASVVGCSKKETIDSQDVTTHGMSLDFKVMSDGTSASAYVAVHVGSYDSNTFASLSTGDNLVLKGPGGGVLPLTKMVEHPAGGGEKDFYVATTNLVDGTYIVDFTRTQGASALGNTLSLPPGFKLTTTATGTKSRKEPLVLNWDGIGTDYVTRVEWSGDCVFDGFKDVTGDPGTFTLGSGDLSATGDGSATCPVKIVVTRKRITSNGFSAEFGHPSNAEGDQSRTITVTSGP